MTNDDLITKSAKILREDDSFWSHRETLIIHVEPNATPLVYDLEERTARLGEAIIDFAKKISGSPLTKRIIDQLVCRKQSGRKLYQVRRFSFQKGVLEVRRHLQERSTGN